MESLPKPPLRAVLFDLDGTLVDSAPDLLTAANKLLAEVGRRALDLSELTLMVGDGVPKLVERCFAATGEVPDEASLKDMYKRYMGFYEGHESDLTRPYPGALEALNRMQAEGYVMAVCTNKPHAPALGLLASLKLERYFPVVIGADSIPGVIKPDPRVLLSALEALGATPDEAIMIGDNQNDVIAARGAGLPVAIATYGYTRVAPADMDADVLFDSLDELPGIFSKIS
ncbi:MAG: phosphoglycolate phosphatase [Rhodospirillales bacterium]|nr:phosphoglycolate phosphatase [Rhodospirillales bacterium]